MSDNDPGRSLPAFLAHAVALERESAERYRELADVMSVHHNPGAAALFARLAELGELHAGQVEARARGLTLPSIPPWLYQWPAAEAPETGPHEETHYLMTRLEVLRYALANEQRGLDFYAGLARGASEAEVRTLAAEFEREETHHVEVLRAWIDRALTDGGDGPTPEDPDPPNLPE
ncbi:MAG: ferritin family protein [Ectothiorhodospiraceae bacterium]|nr:ferritin family protein [Chromatiales bacterium]MCP5153775.1 ferritin family protein [Ectothiorhodospiraceae bacterium]